jgi:hypothetical protein
MRRSLVSGLVVLILAGFGLPRATAQGTITRLIPEAAAPGDTLLILGSNLVGTTTVTFGASVGGFAGWWTITVAASGASATAVLVTVPTFGNFLPPGSLGSGPVGAVTVNSPGATNSLSFFYMEQTQGKYTTPGLGTTQGGLIGRPVIGFTVAGGAPTPGNAAFTLTLGSATPNAPATLAVGAPNAGPLTPYLDGFVGLDLLQPFTLLPIAFVVNQNGDVAFNVPMPPAPLNTTVTVQWAITDPVTGTIGISNGLTMIL